MTNKSPQMVASLCFEFELSTDFEWKTKIRRWIVVLCGLWGTRVIYLCCCSPQDPTDLDSAGPPARNWANAYCVLVLSFVFFITFPKSYEKKSIFNVDIIECFETNVWKSESLWILYQCTVLNTHGIKNKNIFKKLQQRHAEASLQAEFARWCLPALWQVQFLSARLGSVQFSSALPRGRPTSPLPPPPLLLYK